MDAAKYMCSSKHLKKKKIYNCITKLHKNQLQKAL